MHDLTSRHIASHLAEATELLERIPEEIVARIAGAIAATGDSHRRVFVIGNGGSAATADHFATDLAKGATVGHHRVRVESLATNTSLLTALANDLGYDRIFSERLKTEDASSGDALVAISGSGNSLNVIDALETARRLEVLTIGLCGFSGGRMLGLCDLSVVVDGSSIQLVEDAHSVICHAIAVSVRSIFEERDAREDRSPALFIERDGILNEPRPGGVKSWDEFRFRPGALEALARARSAGLRVIVVTQQEPMSRDDLARDAIDAVHERMSAEIERSGGHVEGVLVCAHAAQMSCSCRKPRPGLLRRAAVEFSVDLRRSVLIGHDRRDLDAARAAGCNAILIRDDQGLPNDPIRSVVSISQAIEAVIAESTGPATGIRH